MRRGLIVVALLSVCLVPLGAQAGRGSGDSEGGGSKGGDKGGSGGSSGGSGLTIPGDFAIGLNIAQPLAFILGSSFYEDENTMVAPFPVEIHGHIRDMYGIAATLQFTSYTEGDDLALASILLAAGPRFRFTGKDIQGFYAVPKVGLAYLLGEHPEDDEFKRLAFVIQPEAGFGVRVGDPGLYLAFGVGLQLQLKLLQRPNNVTWSALGKLIVSYTPVINVTVAFGG